MRFISKFTMAVAAIFFALSVSAHAGGHNTTSTSFGKKIYQVCKNWRADQGGWMATDQMQQCRSVLFCSCTYFMYYGAMAECVDGVDSGFEFAIEDPSERTSSDVGPNCKERAKACLRDGNC